MELSMVPFRCIVLTVKKEISMNGNEKKGGFNPNAGQQNPQQKQGQGQQNPQNPQQKQGQGGQPHGQQKQGQQAGQPEQKKNGWCASHKGPKAKCNCE